MYHDIYNCICQNTKKYVGLSQECIYLARLLPYARHPPGVNSLHRIQFVQNSSQLNLDTIVLLDYL